MNSKKPEPLFFPEVGQMCPVCGKRAYSRNGVHPQCAVRQADAPREQAIAEERRKARLVAAEVESGKRQDGAAKKAAIPKKIAVR